MPEETIGFIGLEIMGRPMALNLLHAGYPLVVHNRTRQKEQEIASQGAVSAASPREVTERSEIVITMLPDSWAAFARTGRQPDHGGQAPQLPRA